MTVHDLDLSFKVSLILSERSFVLRENEKRNRLVCSTNCLFYGHAYSLNIVEQILMNSPSPKGFLFTAIDSHKLKLLL